MPSMPRKTARVKVPPEPPEPPLGPWAPVKPWAPPGLTAAPLATTPAAVGAAVAARLRRASGTAPGGLIWVPSTLAPVAAAFRLLPRPLWRRLPR